MIQTRRLLLRRARIEDATDLHAVFTDPRAMRYWDRPPHSDLAQTRRFVEWMAEASPREADDFVMVLDGRAVGKAGCWKVGEVGFILHPELWGRGLVTEALTATIPHAFATHPTPRLEADVDPRNAAALRVLAKLGFRETGRAARTILVGEEWCDSVYLALDRPPPS
jgi:RimJ/RimL family protein N-acetyltransferase